jgi:hypothetical protein
MMSGLEALTADNTEAIGPNDDQGRHHLPEKRA